MHLHMRPHAHAPRPTPHAPRQVEHFLTEFWEMLAYFGNTLIFVITGVVVVEGLGRPESSEAELSATDFYHLALIYLGCLIIRAALVLTAYALFNATGMLRLEWKW